MTILIIFISIVWFMIGVYFTFGLKHHQPICRNRWDMFKINIKELLIYGPVGMVFLILEKLQKFIRKIKYGQ